MTNEELFAVLRPIVMTVTGVSECILADQNAPAPTGIYASIRPKQLIEPYGQSTVTYANATGYRVAHTIKQAVVCDCSITFFRGDAQTNASLMAGCNKRPDVSATLRSAGLGWRDHRAINNLTGLQANNWEQRAEITIKLWYVIEQTVNTNSIEDVAITVVDEANNTVVPELYTYDPPEAEWNGEGTTFGTLYNNFGTK